MTKSFVLASIKALLAFGLLWVYYALACRLNDAYQSNHKLVFDAEYICTWSLSGDGIMMLATYIIMSYAELFFKGGLSVIKYFLIAIVLYVIVYGTIAFVYMLASFMQPMNRNIFFHLLFLFLLFELLFRYFKKLLVSPSLPPV